MVEAEVQSAMKKKENTLDALMDKIQQQLDHGMSCEASIKILQTRMVAVAERAEKALAHLNETPTPPFQSPTPPLQTPTSPFHTPTTHFQTPTPPLADAPVVRSHLEVNNVRSLSQTSLSVEGSSVSEFMENTKKEFERLHAENAALRAAFEDIRERASPSPTAMRRQPGVMEGLAKLMHIKKEPADPPEDVYPKATVPMKRIKEEFPCPEAEHNSKRIKLEPTEHPPLPQLPIPVSVPSEAARYNIPPRLKVDVALIKNPSPQLTVWWDLEDKGYIAPPMNSYSVFFTAEQVYGFEEWKIRAECKAVPLPTYSLITPDSPSGKKICVTVVGKDQFGRYGPFSNVACAYI